VELGHYDQHSIMRWKSSKSANVLKLAMLATCVSKHGHE